MDTKNLPVNPTYLPCDYRSLELHTLIASKIRQTPSLFCLPYEHIARWKAQNQFPQPYLDDWLFILDQGLEHTLSFMTSASDEAQRLRSSSPFVGILTPAERRTIFRKYTHPPHDPQST